MRRRVTCAQCAPYSFSLSSSIERLFGSLPSSPQAEQINNFLLLCHPSPVAWVWLVTGQVDMNFAFILVSLKNSQVRCLWPNAHGRELQVPMLIAAFYNPPVLNWPELICAGLVNSIETVQVQVQRKESPLDPIPDLNDVDKVYLDLFSNCLCLSADWQYIKRAVWPSCWWPICCTVPCDKPW